MKTGSRKQDIGIRIVTPSPFSSPIRGEEIRKGSLKGEGRKNPLTLVLSHQGERIKRGDLIRVGDEMTFCYIFWLKKGKTPHLSPLPEGEEIDWNMSHQEGRTN